MGEFSGQIYCLGDCVEVCVEVVNMDECKIDFSLIFSECVLCNVGKMVCEKVKKGDVGKKGGKCCQVGKKVNFELDSVFCGEKKMKLKVVKKDVRKVKKLLVKMQKIVVVIKAKRVVKKKVVE